MFHGKNIYNEQVRVPLIFFTSDGSLSPRRLPGIVEHVDLLPTLVDLSGNTDLLPRQLMPVEGRSLAPLLLGAEAAGASERAAFVQRRTYSVAPPALGANPSSSEVLRASRYEPGEKFALVESGWKYIHRTEGGDELFDLKADPRETRNLVAEVPARAESMKAQLLGRVAALAAGVIREASPPDPETLELLETLGYVQ
jgi:arylsulfatase A-like enzyme